MTKNNSNKSDHSKSHSNEGKVALKDESHQRVNYSINESKSETITSHLASPTKPTDTDATKK